MPARIRKGDTVVVISGKHQGKTGKVLRILRDDDRVVVAGVNVVKRHMRPTQQNQAGGIVEREQPIHACKVMPVDPKTVREPGSDRESSRMARRCVLRSKVGTTSRDRGVGESWRTIEK